MRKPAHASKPKKSKGTKHEPPRTTITDFYTAEQKRQMDSEKLEAQMFEHLKKLRKPSR